MSKNLGLALTAEGWAIAEIIRGKTGRLTQLLSGEWSPEDPVATKAAILKQVFQRYQWAKGKVVVSVPMKAGYWKELHIPALAPRATELLIRNTFFSSIPQPPDAFLWQYKKYKSSGQQRRVACFALPAQVGSEIKSLLDQAAINPFCFLPDLYSLNKGLNVVARRGYHPEETVLLVIGHPEALETALVKGEDLVYYRCFPLLLDNGRIDRGALEEDLRLTKYMVRKESRYLPSLCCFWDQTGQCTEEEWKAILSSAFTLEPNRIQPFSALGFPASFDAGKAEAVLRRVMAVGLALEAGASEPGLRLVIGNSWRSTQERKWALSVLIFGLVIALSGVSLNAWLNYRERESLIRSLAEKEAKVEAITNWISLEEQVKEEIAFYRQAWDKTRQMLEFFIVWSETVPEGTILTSVLLENEQITQLSGRCLSFSQLYTALLASPDFRQLELKGEITVNRDGYECFTLAGRWNEENEDED